MLARHYVERFSRELDREVRDLAPEALDLLLSHSWPGNIRELQGVLKQAINANSNERHAAADHAGFLASPRRPRAALSPSRDAEKEQENTHASSPDTRAADAQRLPLDHLEQVPQSLRDAPETALSTFETRTDWLGAFRSRTLIEGYEAGGQRIARRHVIDADEPAEVLGTDTAPNPQELLFSAIGSCISAVYAGHASLLGITLRSVRVELRGTLDMRGVMLVAEVPPGYPEVQCRVFVDADATPEQVQALHGLALKASPNVYHLIRRVLAAYQAESARRSDGLCPRCRT